MKVEYRLSLATFSIVLACIFVQCSEDSSGPKTETPLSKFIKEGTWSYTTIDATDRSIGNKFSVLTSGKITALGLNSSIEGTFDVALYEVAAGNTPTLIGSTSVTITQTEIDADPEMFKYANLDNAVSVITGKIYCVAYTTNATNQKRLDIGVSNPGFTLPIEASSSKVSIQIGTYGTADAFPENDQAEVIFMADVKFKY